MKKGRVLAIILVFCLLFAHFPQSNLFVSADEQSISENSIDAELFFENIVEGDDFGAGETEEYEGHTYYVESQDVIEKCVIEYTSSDGTILAAKKGTELSNGTSLHIKCYWNLTNAADDKMNFVINLRELENVTITHLEQEESMVRLNNTSEEIGVYFIRGDKMYIRLDPSMGGESERKGFATVDAALSVDESKNSLGEEIDVGIANHTTKITFVTTSPSSLGLSKSILSTEDNGRKQNFQIKLSAWGGDVKICDDFKDEMGKGLTLDSGGITVNDPSGQVGGVYADMDAFVMAMQGLTIPGGTEITAEYSAIADEGIYNVSNSDSVKYKNTVTTHYEKNNHEIPEWPISASVNASVNRPKVSKKGVYNAKTKKASWTISINLGDRTLGDGEKLGDIITGIKDIPSKDFEGYNGTKEFIPEGGWDIVLNSLATDTEGNYTYTYELPVTTDAASSAIDVTLKNTLTLKIDGESYTASVSNAMITGNGPLTKSCTGFDSGTNLLEWRAKIGPFREGITSVTIDDTLYGGAEHKFIQDLYVQAGDDGNKIPVMENGKIVDDNPVIKNENFRTYKEDVHFRAVFNDSFISDSANKNIYVYYHTKVLSAIYNTDYHNNITLNYYDENGGFVTKDTTAIWRMDASDVLKKKGKAGTITADGKQTIDYSIFVDLSKLEDIDSDTLLQIEDTFSPELAYVDGSVNRTLHYGMYDWGWQMEEWEKNLGDTKVTVVEGDAGTLKFQVDFSPEFINYFKENIAKDTNFKPSLHINYTLKVNDEAAFIRDGETKTFENKISGQYGEQDLGSNGTDVSLKPDNLVKKTYNYTRKTAPYIEYTIYINENGLNINNGNRLSGTDKLTDTNECKTVLSYVEDSVKVYTKDEKGGWTKVLPSEKYNYDFDDDKKILNFELPDLTPIMITYKTKVNLPMNVLESDNDIIKGTSAENTFSLEGKDHNNMRSSVSYIGSVHSNIAGASSETGSVTIVKKWQNGYIEGYLDDCTFKVYEVDYDEDLKKMKGPVNTEKFPPKDIFESKDGKYFVDKLQYDHYYALEEVAVPSGFAKSDKIVYFLIQGFDKRSFPEGIKGETFEMSSNNDIEFWNEPENPGELTITKTISSINNLTDSDLKKIKFEIENPTGTTATYNLGKFDYDGKEYTLNLTNQPVGKYKITETSDIENYDVSVSYTVNGGEDVTASSIAEVEVVGNQNTTVNFTNEYTKIVKLVIKKTISGDITPEQAKDRISFEVTAAKDRFSAYEPNVIPLNDFVGPIDNGDGSYTYTKEITNKDITELMGMTFTVTETAAEIDGMTISKQCFVNEAEQENRSAGTIKIEKDVNTVDFINNYQPVFTATPTPTESSSPAPTESSSPAPTESSSPAPTESSSPAPTGSSSPTPAESSSPAPTGSSSPSPTESSSPAPTGSSSPSPTESSSPAPTESSSPAPTESSSPTPAESSSPAPTVKPGEPTQTIKPGEPTPTVKPGEPTPTIKPGEPTPTVKPGEPTPTVKPGESTPAPTATSDNSAPTVTVKPGEPTATPTPSITPSPTPADDDDDDDEPAPDSTSSTFTVSPKTGDDTHAGVYTIVIIFSIISAFVLKRRAKRT